MTTSTILDESGVDGPAVLEALRRIVAAELGGAVAYTRYAALIGGLHRLSLSAWFDAQAAESLTHARRAAEILVGLGGTMPDGVDAPDDVVGTRELLTAARDHERAARDHYRQLLTLVEGHSVMLEEYARSILSVEEEHALELDRLLAP